MAEHHILKVNVGMKVVFLLEVLINDKQLFEGIFKSAFMFNLKENVEHSNNNVLHSFNKKLMMTLLKIADYYTFRTYRLSFFSRAH